jgi:acyl-CoA synthetase (AMP-forming)/AMP-acid ligase II
LTGYSLLCSWTNLKFLPGRMKELINRGGEKISPVEVDAVLLQHEVLLLSQPLRKTNRKSIGCKRSCQFWNPWWQIWWRSGSCCSTETRSSREWSGTEQ